MRCDGWGVHWSTEHARHTRRGARRTAPISHLGPVVRLVTFVWVPCAWPVGPVGTGVAVGGPDSGSSWCPVAVLASHLTCAASAPPPAARRRVPACMRRSGVFRIVSRMGSVIASGVGVCSPVSTWTFVEKGKKEFMKKEKAPSAKAEGEAEPEDFDGDRELRRVRPEPDTRATGYRTVQLRARAGRPRLRADHEAYRRLAVRRDPTGPQT